MRETWAITTFYNPLGGAIRRRNYEVFRRHLRLPLLTIEWSLDGQFELGPDDAEILVQLSGGDLMWQKERLLNLGVERLPAGCRYVAWLDCDIVFHNPDWAGIATELCRTHDVVQLFETAHDLPDSDRIDGSFDEILAIPPLTTRPSIARAIAGGGTLFSAATSERLKDPNFLPNGKVGMAYMAPVDLLAQARLYDANIVGGGDLVFAATTLDRLEELVSVRPFAAGHREDIVGWARRARSALSGRTARFTCAPVEVSHLWHGAKVSRVYSGRYRILERLGFDPSAHLALDGSRLWSWRAEAGELKSAVEQYILSRGDG